LSALVGGRAILSARASRVDQLQTGFHSQLPNLSQVSLSTQECVFRSGTLGRTIGCTQVRNEQIGGMS
jgi:hypothetical protein